MTNRQKAIKGAIEAGYKVFIGGSGFYAVKIRKNGSRSQKLRMFSGYQTQEDALTAVGSTLDLDWE